MIFSLPFGTSCPAFGSQKTLVKLFLQFVYVFLQLRAGFPGIYLPPILCYQRQTFF